MDRGFGRAFALASLVAVSGCLKRQEQTATSADTNVDPRTAVVLPAEGQQAVLREMRQMLGAMGGAMAAAVSGDTAALIASVAPAQSAAAADPALEALLPPAWKELADRTHGGFDDLVTAVRQSRGPAALKDTVLMHLARVSGSCTACHETFRIAVR